MLALLTTLMLTLAAPGEGDRPTIPDDARLGAARLRIDQLVDRAAAEGLPAEMIVSKVREGLAKGVDAARIEAAALRLTDSLEAAQRFVAARRTGPPATSLVRAVAEARLAGVSLGAVDPLVRGERPEPQSRRAVEVVTDLSLRGYPADRAATVVRDVMARDARSVDRLPGTLETIRRDYALSQSEAVDAIARGLASSDSLQSAYSRTVEDERRQGRGHGAGSDKSAEGRDDAPGKSGLAPGHLKMRPPTAGPKKPR